jgi:hypothetical protein
MPVCPLVSTPVLPLLAAGGLEVPSSNLGAPTGFPTIEGRPGQRWASPGRAVATVDVENGRTLRR